MRNEKAQKRNPFMLFGVLVLVVFGAVAFFAVYHEAPWVEGMVIAAVLSGAFVVIVPVVQRLFVRVTDERSTIEVELDTCPKSTADTRRPEEECSSIPPAAPFSPPTITRRSRGPEDDFISAHRDIRREIASHLKDVLAERGLTK